LVHPDGKTVAANDTHRDHRPDENREHEECEQFLTPTIARRNVIVRIAILKI
jgi:hypothetical protein